MENFKVDITDPEYSFLQDKGYVLSNVFPRVYPLHDEDGKYNKLFMEGNEKVAMQLHDLMQLFYINLEDNEEYNSAICISTKFIEELGITREELAEAAWKNTMSCFSFRDIGEVLREKSGLPELIFPNTKKMFVVSNTSMHFGAINGFIPEAWKQIYEEIGDFYILPSSIHEVIILKDEDQETEALYKMVNEITSKQVPEEEKLPVSIYHFGLCGFEHVA